MRLNSTNPDRRSDHTANAALLAIMLLIASGATFQVQTSGARSNTLSNRDSMIHGIHVTAQDLLLCSEVSCEIDGYTLSPAPAGESHDTAPREDRALTDAKERRNLPPPHRA